MLKPVLSTQGCVTSSPRHSSYLVQPLQQHDFFHRHAASEWVVKCWGCLLCLRISFLSARWYMLAVKSGSVTVYDCTACLTMMLYCSWILCHFCVYHMSFHNETTDVHNNGLLGTAAKSWIDTVIQDGVNNKLLSEPRLMHSFSSQAIPVTYLTTTDNCSRHQTADKEGII